MIRLTDKEIENKRILGYNNQMSNEAIENLLKIVADCQVKKFAEWLKSDVLEDCHEGYSNVMCFHRRALKALLEE